MLWLSILTIILLKDVIQVLKMYKPPHRLWDDLKKYNIYTVYILLYHFDIIYGDLDNIL